MDLTQSERAQAVVRYLAKKNGVTQAQVGRRLGYSNKSALSAILNGLKPLPIKFAEKLTELDPSINPAFLSGDSDEMLLPGFDQPSVSSASGRGVPGGPSGVFIATEQLLQMLTTLTDAVRSQQETIRSQQETIRASLGTLPLEKGNIG